MLQELASAGVGWLLVLPIILWDSRGAPGKSLPILLPALAVYFATDACLILPHYVHPLRIGNWNWSGKIISSMFLYAAILMLPALRPARSYLTWRQRPGFIPGAALALALLFAIQATAQILYGGSEKFDLETLAFQATLPGINEEPQWRALVLGAVNAICRSRVRVLGVDLGWAVVVNAALFALAHALAFDTLWHVQFDLISLVYVAAVGLILGYVAELTGSILLPVLYHNIFNVAGHAWQMAR
jgi:hypothetical protein